MAQTQLHAKDLSGFNIYHSKNQTIYWDAFTKTAYIISQSDVNSFSTWQLKLPLTMLMGLMLILFGLNSYLALAASVVVYIVATVIFEVKYLPTLAMSLKWQKPKSQGFIKDTAIKFKYSSILTIAIMFAIFAVMFFIYVIVFRTNTTAVITYGLLSAVSIVVTVISFKVAAARKKMDKENIGQ